MNVYIHATRVYLYKKNAARELFRGNVGGKGLLQSRHCRLALDVSSVDEEILEISVSLYVIGAPDITRDLDSLGASLHGNKAGGKISAKYRIYRRMKLPVTHGFKLDVSV